MRNIVGWYHLPFTAWVSDGGAYVEVHLAAAFHATGGNPYTWIYEREWTKSTPGTEEVVLSDLLPLPDLVPEDGFYGMMITVYVTATVKNDGRPAGFFMPEGLTFDTVGSPSDGSAAEPSVAVLLFGILPMALVRRNRKAASFHRDTAA